MPAHREWHRLFFYRREGLRTTWKFRLATLAISLLVPFLTRSLWVPAIANSLTCREQVAAADAILIDNFDQNYLLFERAATIYNAGHSPRVLLPTIDTSGADGPTVEQGIVDVMVRIAHLKTMEIIPVRQTEPISLNVAYQIRDYLTKERIQSVMVVTSGLRAKRAWLIYDDVLGHAGVTVSCVPVFGTITPETWTNTLHGMQEVALQFLKLQYYRFYVLPFASRPAR
jgi:hypothetical protein